MAFKYNPATGQMEDESGAPATGPIAMNDLLPTDAKPASLGTVARLGGQPNDVLQKALDESPAAQMDGGERLPSIAGQGPAARSPSLSPPAQVPAVQPSGNQLYKSGETKKTGWSKPIEAPGERQHMAALTADIEDQKKLEEKKLDLARTKANNDQKIADDEVVRATTNQEKQRAMQADFQQRLGAAQAESNTQYEKFKNLEPTDFWADKSTGQKVTAGIAIALGALGSGLAGGTENRAIQVIDNAIQQDMNLKRMRQEKQAKVYEASKGRIGDVRTANEDAQQALQLETAAAYQKAIAQTKALLAKTGVPAAEIESNATVLALAQKEHEMLLQHDQGLRGRAEGETVRTMQAMDPAFAGGGANGRPSSDENKAAGFAERMGTQLQRIKELPPLSKGDREAIMKHAALEDFYAKHPNAKLAAQTLGQYKTLEEKLSDPGRATYQSAREFISANLRRESGAAIGQGEIADALQRYLPVAGDSKEDAARKVQAMEQATASVYREAGRASGSIRQPVAGQGAPPSPEAAPSLPAGAVRGTYKGKSGYRLGNQFFPLE